MFSNVTQPLWQGKIGDSGQGLHVPAVSPHHTTSYTGEVIYEEKCARLEFKLWDKLKQIVIIKGIIMAASPPPKT